MPIRPTLPVAGQVSMHIFGAADLIPQSAAGGYGLCCQPAAAAFRKTAPVNAIITDGSRPDKNPTA